MKSLEIGFRNFEVAFAALIENPLAETGNIDPVDGVRKMTIVAHRQLLIRLGYLGTMHAFPELLTDAEMAGRTSPGYIMFVDGGIRVVGRQFTVCGMTIQAGGCHHQTTLQEPLTVDAHGIIVDNFDMIAGLGNRSTAAFAMTLTTKIRYVARKDR